MKTKLRSVNACRNMVPRGDDLTDAIAMKRMFPKASFVTRGCQGHLIIGDSERNVITVLPPNTKAFPTVLYGQSVEIKKIIIKGGKRE